MDNIMKVQDQVNCDEIKTGDNVIVSWGEVVLHGTVKKINSNNADVYILDGVNKGKTLNFENCYIQK